jgi:hypothetical protein
MGTGRDSGSSGVFHPDHLLRQRLDGRAVLKPGPPHAVNRGLRPGHFESRPVRRGALVEQSVPELGPEASGGALRVLVRAARLSPTRWARRSASPTAPDRTQLRHDSSHHWASRRGRARGALVAWRSARLAALRRRSGLDGRRRVHRRPRVGSWQACAGCPAGACAPTLRGRPRRPASRP